MPRLTTFATLRTCADLLVKAQHDLGRMTSSMGDEYAAFDFFITAEHLVDWYLPNDKHAQRALREGEPLLQVVSHIANGVKHFRATAPQHTSVADVHRKHYADVGYIETGYWGDVLTVELSLNEAALLGFQSIEAYQLALRVFAYWREKLGI